MIKAIIVDCFGVLVGRGFEETYRIAGGDPVKDKNFINDTLGQANLGMLSEEVFHTQMAARLNISLGRWQQSITEAEKLNEAFLQLIKQLHKKYKTAVLSNANKGVVESRIGTQWIAECFDLVIVSADIGMVKPDPDIYEYTAEQLEVKPAECIFIDDKKVFLGPAQDIGMQAVLYEDFAQTKTELEAILAADSKD